MVQINGVKIDDYEKLEFRNAKVYEPVMVMPIMLINYNKRKLPFRNCVSNG